MSGNGRLLRSRCGLDKLGIRIDPVVCNIEMKGMYKEEGILTGEDHYGMPGVEGINIINKGQYYYIMYHDILFSDPNKFIIDVVYEGLVKLFRCQYPFLKEFPSSEFMARYCHLAEIEFYYDFYNFNPVTAFNRECFNICHETTLYTPDYRQKFNRDGSVKETFKSIGIIYDKGMKEFTKERRWRIEFKFQKNYLRGLSFEDLFMTTNQLYQEKLYKKIVFYTRKFYKPEYIDFDINNIQLVRSPFWNVILQAFYYRK